MKWVVPRTKPAVHSGPRGRDHRQNVAVVENPLLVHAVAMQRHRRESVGLDFVLGKLVDVFQAVQRVIFAGRVVLPELDLRAQHRRLRRHPVLHPPGGNEDDVRELLHDLAGSTGTTARDRGSSPCD